MSVRVFLDTNVLVYAYDKHEPAKQAKAQSLLTAAVREENGFLSTQVLSEFFTVVTGKIRNPLSAHEAGEVIEMLGILQIQEIDFEMVRRAIDTHKRYGISYWDSLVLSAAERAECAELHSEDLKDGETYNGVRVVNPFPA
jgi:predicted nucleic acid-binding protein